MDLTHGSSPSVFPTTGIIGTSHHSRLTFVYLKMFKVILIYFVCMGMEIRGQFMGVGFPEIVGLSDLRVPLPAELS